MSRQWTDEEKAKLVVLVGQGLKWWDIGFQLGRTGDAVQMMAGSMKLGPKPFKGKRSAVWRLMVRICADGRPRTVHELVALTGASRVCIDRLMKEGHADGEAHTAGWLKSRRGPPKPLWLPVPGTDAPKPYVPTASERQCARMRRMKEEDPLRYKAIIDRCTLRRKLKRGVVAQQHPVVQALFGMGVAA
ncbi:hypothetical protein [Cupriavidus sp. 2SB]|uniref:hypothetical protein n=1 Tax=Cupriavidus sp. 2SB TaxID=2502199 RepID=UPI0010F8AC72|nr:hypothetical protein [Cupriavidus sp. 2SB]